MAWAFFNSDRMAGNCLIFSFSSFVQSRLDLYFTELSPVKVVHICGLLVR